MVIVDQKLKNRSRKMSQVQSDGEDDVVETVIGPDDDETAETEADFRQPRGSDRVPEDRPIITGAVGAEPDERDPGQICRLGSLGGPNRNGPEMGCRFRKLRDRTNHHREPGHSQGSW